MQIQSSHDDILFKDVPLAVGTILGDVRTLIDREFGAGFAHEHPDLVAACVRAGSDHLNVASALKVLEGIADNISLHLENIDP